MGHVRGSLVGVGGWLAFLIVTLALGAFGALASTAITLQHLAAAPHPAVANEAWTAYLVVTLLLGFGMAGARGWMAWLLNRRLQPRTPRLVICGLWAVVIIPAAVDTAAGALLLGMDARTDGELFGRAFVQPLVYALVWTLYLLRSQRVRNTYAPDEGELAALFH